LIYGGRVGFESELAISDTGIAKGLQGFKNLEGLAEMVQQFEIHPN
jgi:hypothetical protein